MLKKIRSNYIIKTIFNYTQLNLGLKIVKNSKYFQSKLGLKKNDYKEYSQIIIDLIPETDDSILSEKNIFINYISEENKKFYHIYFNNDLKTEILRPYFFKNENVSKIKIYIDHNITSLRDLFEGCNVIKEINFINFNRKNITDMSCMFQHCNSLTKINFNKFTTNNVISMNYMFYQCFALKELNLSNFDTTNVISMKKMFFECRFLKTIIFGEKFKVNKVLNMIYLFYNCYNLIDIDISNFVFDKEVDMINIFKGCSKKLINKIKKQNNKLKEDAF